jgi:aspartate kinase
MLLHCLYLLQNIACMIVFKFGGASVKDAAAVRNLAEIVGRYKNEKLVVVISAMGKTTNALEQVFEKHFQHQAAEAEVRVVKEYHHKIISGLFPDSSHEMYAKVDEIFKQLEKILSQPSSDQYDKEYDQIVSLGEILSTLIVAEYLNHAGIPTQWMDVRKYLKTDNTYREGVVDFAASEKLVGEAFKFNGSNIYLTQGFLGSSKEGFTTTLGREGSDYTAAIFAYLLNAEQVTIWKDVPGVLNADPKFFPDTVKLDQLSYLDAIELAYYGTSVIHPKTIQPLRNKNIKLFVKSFLKPADPGTLVSNISHESSIPLFIIKTDQVLLRIHPNDFSFIAEEKLHSIFGCFARHNIKINLMQNSAVSFQVCVTNVPLKLMRLIDDLAGDFKIKYETGLELITIRHYNQATIDRMLVNKELVLEQKSRKNIQMVVRDRG